MSGARIPVDRLWRCLCPSIDAVALATAISVPSRPRRVGSLGPTTPCAGPRAAPRRHLHTTSPKLQDDSAEKQAESPAVSADAETKANKDSTAKATDFIDGKAGLKIDSEATKVWKGYFDVVFVDSTEERQDGSLPISKQLVEDASPGKAHAEAQNKDMSNATNDADRAGQKELLPSPKLTAEQSSSTVASGDAGPIPIDERSRAVKQQYSSPNVFCETSPSPLSGEDNRKVPFEEAWNESVAKDPFDSLVDSSNQQQRKLPKYNDFGEDTPSTVAGTDAKQASFNGSSVTEIPVSNDSGASPPFMVVEPGSTGSGPTNENKTKVDQVRSTPKKGNSEMADRLLQMKSPFKDVPPEAEKEDILLALQRARMRGPRRFRRITATLLKHLLSMDPKPKPFYYDLIFRAHCLPEGSADVIAKLLQEMRQERVHWSANAYHSVLRALTIHPNYLMRNVILREMKERWIDITPKGHRFIALGLLRDEQYELALEKLDQMIQQGIEVDPWVFDIFIYVFGKLGFLDDALRLVRHRLDRGFDVSVNIWYFLLDMSSKGQNHQTTTYVWNRTVQQGIVNPSDGIALNVLNMASVYGDTDLATQVIQYLSERGTRLSRPHYEALADAYSVQGYVERAIEVYCIMYGAGAEVNQASAGTLCQSLSRDPSRIDKAVEAMTELKKKYKLPVGVFNAVLNEMVKSSASPPEKAFVRALELYRRIREFLPAGPNWETFRNLLWRCTMPDVAQFLAGEMVAFNIRQNLVIIEQMFRVNVEHNGPTHRVKTAFYKVAPHLHSDYAPGSRRWQNIMDLSVKLVKRLIGERDPEAWRILDICRRNGLEEDKIMALRDEVEAGRLPTTDAPAFPDVSDGESPGLRKF